MQLFVGDRVQSSGSSRANGRKLPYDLNVFERVCLCRTMQNLVAREISTIYRFACKRFSADFPVERGFITALQTAGTLLDVSLHGVSVDFQLFEYLLLEVRFSPHVITPVVTIESYFVGCPTAEP